MSNEEIINRIKYIRERAGFTQKALSLAAGVNQNYINRLESKKDFVPSIGVLMQIIQVCKSTPEEFFADDIEHYAKEIKHSISIDITPIISDATINGKPLKDVAAELALYQVQQLVEQLNAMFGKDFAKISL